MTMPQLPEPKWGSHGYTAAQMREYAAAAVAAEREKWLAGVKMSIPSETMEQEFSAHHRRGFAAGRVAAVPQWQPIETAPKDGRDVLIMYMHIDTQCVHNAYYAAEQEGYDDDIGWWTYEFSEVSRTKLTGFMEPTHWMPLPAAPEVPR